MRDLAVLVVDDSAMNRRTLADLLGALPGVRVVGVASDGDEALRLSASLSPDLITLDLEMPRMDGFTFLRLLMASRPVPVVVVSSHSARDNVFRALELGAIDFVAKPEALLAGSSGEVREQLERMVAMVRQLSPAGAQHRRSTSSGPPAALGMTRGEPLDRPLAPAARIVVIASSTGGPTALLDLFAQLPPRSDTAIVVAQHMPERFTRAFAERLDRMSRFAVKEAEGTEPLLAGTGLVCPGGRCVEVDRGDGRAIVRVVDAAATDRYAPSADRLFCSAARVFGARAVGLVLTGMGDDGAAGVVELKRAGGQVYVESEESAIVFGMPRAAARTGCADEVLPLPKLLSRVAALLDTEAAA